MLCKNDLLGAWHLDSWTISYSDSERISHPFGEQPTGMIVYTDDDWMSASINRSDRDLLPTGSAFRRTDPGLLADAYRSYFHYAGHYAIQDDVVTHTVTQSLNPNFVGSKQLRNARLSGQTLELSGTEEVDGVTRTHRLSWRRMP
ncbi:lipocalin-like domain-containing protein [Congregibacter sp.]|uniref:lipocalin-like domain-containing protein n=1 Tax=Congregibacter sp. TaxID=2744308 RepID=UPI003F6D3DEE